MNGKVQSGGVYILVDGCCSIAIHNIANVLKTSRGDGGSANVIA